MADYGEIFCTAVNEIVQQRLGSLSYDITKDCTVVSIENKIKDEYIVSDGSSTFIAYAAAGAPYELGDQVLVTIPRGDYSCQKTIINKLTTEVSSTGYVSPLDQFKYGTDKINLGSGQLTIPQGQAAATDKTPLSVVRKIANFSKMAITANVKFIPDENSPRPTRGTYGIKLLLTCNNQILELTFASTEMLGNPYYFETYFYQEALFTIPDDIKTISRIEAFLYCDDQFDAPGIVSIEDITLQFGIDLSAASNNTLTEIFELTSNSDVYGEIYAQLRELKENHINDLDYADQRDQIIANHTKILSLSWIHQVAPGEFEVVNNLDNGYNLKLFRKTVKNPQAKNEKEFDWDDNEQSSTQPNGEMDIDGWAEVKSGSFLFDSERGAFIYNITQVLSVTSSSEKYKVEGTATNRNGKVITLFSNEITFTNQTPPSTYVPSEEARAGLSLGFTDGSFGNYFLYDQNGVIFEDGTNPQTTERGIEILYNLEPLTIESKYYNEISTIEWKYPTSNTMITRVDEDNGLLLLSKYIIGQFWDRTKSKNNIDCEITFKNGDKIALTEVLRFGPQGTSGTANTFILEMVNDNALIANGNSTLQVKAMLIAKNGQHIDVSNTNFSLINGHPSITLSASGDTATLSYTGSGVPHNNYTILQASYGDNPTLYAFLPIPIKSGVSVGPLMAGATEIIYNHQGIPSYSTNAYELRNSVVSWGINGDGPNEPALENNIIAPASLYTYLEGNVNNSGNIIQDRACVYCNDWSQPILIMQSKYDYAVLNAWGGDLDINEEANRIMAAMIGAGKKHEDNTFSGVLLGDVRVGTNLESAPQHTGVYGFNHGAMAYALKDDGTAFFGASGKGRIEFDGNKGVIKSTGWTEVKNEEKNITTWEIDDANKSGTLLDLDDAVLKLKAKNDQDIDNYIYFNADPENPGSLEIKVSSANIILNDKENQPTLGGYIQATEESIVTEMYENIIYNGICETEDGTPTKKVILDKALPETWPDKLTIAVKFVHAQTVAEETTKDSTNKGQQSTTTRTGQALFLKIGEEGSDLPIYVNGAQTNTVPQVIVESNYNTDAVPFGWEAGSILYFRYENGNYWNVTDSVSRTYSQSIQQSNLISDLVVNTNAETMTALNQTAEAITAQVNSISANYSGTYDSDKKLTVDGTQYECIELQGTIVTEDAENLDGLLYKQGTVIAVTCTKKKEEISSLFTYIKYGELTTTSGLNIYYRGNPISETNPYGWESGDTIFISYGSGRWNIVDSGAYSKIKQTKDAIIHEVGQKANYYCTCDGEPTQDGKLILSCTDDTFNNLTEIKTGFIVTVQFTKALDIGADQSVSFAFGNNMTKLIAAPVKWEAGEALPFMYNGEKFVLTSLSSSKITQTKNAIMSEVRRTAGYGASGTIDENGVLNVTLANNDFDGDGTNDSLTEILKSGITLNVYITGASADAEGTLVEIKQLKLIVGADSDTSSIYLQGTNLNNAQSEKKLAYQINDTINFSYMTDHWNVVDSGAYSKITQTADGIQLQVASIKGDISAIEQTAESITQRVQDAEGNISDIIQTAEGITQRVESIEGDISTIEQTATQLELKVASGANYYCTCADDGAERTLTVPNDFPKLSENMKSGLTISVYFTHEYKPTGDNSSLSFAINGHNEDEPYSVIGNNLTWNAGETLSFIYNGEKFVLTSMSQGVLDITKNSIISSVSSKNGCAGKCDEYARDSNNQTAYIYTITMYDSDFSDDNLQTGIIMSVKFNKPKSGASQYLKIGSNGAKYKIEGNVSWETTEVVYFMFIEESSTNKYWRQTTADVESKITQLSGEISGKVSSEGGADGFSWVLTDSGFTLTSTIDNASTEVFKCDKNGVIIDGTITAQAGSKIGGWTLTDYKIYAGSGAGNCAVIQVPNYNYGSGTTKWVFAAGGDSHDSYGDAPFRVDMNGNVHINRLYMGTGGRVYFGSDNYLKYNSGGLIWSSNSYAFYANKLEGSSVDCANFYIKGTRFAPTAVSINGNSYTVLAQA